MGSFSPSPRSWLTVTLIEDEESAGEAREDARGAVVGSVALAVFAAGAVALFGEIAGGLALAVASGAWCLVAIGLYLVLWGSRGGRVRSMRTRRGPLEPLGAGTHGGAQAEMPRAGLEPAPPD